MKMKNSKKDSVNVRLSRSREMEVGSSGRYNTQNKCSQLVEFENFPLSDVTNVQQSKGNYSQRLYDSSFSGVTSTEQGHTFITPTVKRSSAFTKDIDTQDREFVRLPLSDVTNG
nr:hypothetical protein Iba_chr13bCG9080 [Ipomoea batatas]